MKYSIRIDNGVVMIQPSLNNNRIAPPSKQPQKDDKSKKPRSSNFELYRILCMIMIVAHHYVVNSGLIQEDGPLTADVISYNSIFLSLFGAWGKTGINCFLMITGFFMCTQHISLRKFVKMIGHIYIYNWLLFIFLANYETTNPQRLIRLIFPFWGFTDGFVSCFVAFWLTIPFLNVLVQNMSKRQHELLLLLLLGMYTFLGTVPSFHVSFNYVVWFGVIYFVASFIRLYPQKVYEHKSFWMWMTIINVALGMSSILFLRLWKGCDVALSYYFVSDCNRIFAVSIALCSFLWFKNICIEYNKVINAFGAGTFGVLLIHANSDAMRTWLWKDFIDVTGHYTLPLSQLVLYSMGVVLAIFIVCNLIDQLRIATLEKWFLGWYDKCLSVKVDRFVNR